MNADYTNNDDLIELRRNLYEAVRDNNPADFLRSTAELTLEYPDLSFQQNVLENLNYIPGLDDVLRDFYVRHTRMVEAIVTQNKPEIQYLWYSSFQDENTILLPLKYYIQYAKNNKLSVWRWMQCLEQLPWFESIRSIVGMLEDYKRLKQQRPQRKVRRRGNHSGGSMMKLDITEQMVCF